MASLILQSTSAGLLDVALDIPLPVYHAVAATGGAALFPLRRLLIVLVTAVIVGLVRRALSPRIGQFFLGLVGGKSSAETSSARAVAPLETYSPTSKSSRMAFGSSSTIDVDANSGTNDDNDDAENGDEVVSTAMIFDDEGWGQARFLSQQKIADSSLIKLSFELPRSTDYLPLAVGEKLRICCMGQNDTSLMSEVYPYGDASSGQFSILVEDPSLSEEEDEQAEVVQTIINEFETGDELAIQPAALLQEEIERISPWKLSKNNIDTIVYWANGSGIAPAMDHVRVILDDEASSVENANLLWVNSAIRDFEYAQLDLEKEYERQSDRLAISCISEDAPTASEEIDEALVQYQPGMMAVLSGPRKYTADAARFLMENKGFPDEALCFM
jgi:hypothetical protein